MKKSITIVNLLFLFLMCTLVAGYGLANLSNLRETANVVEFTQENWKQSSAELERQLKERLIGRSNFIDLYGVSLRALHKNMIGNFEFVKDDQGIVQLIGALPQNDSFEQSVIELHKRLEEEEIPLVYLQAPDRADGCYLSDEVYCYGDSIDERICNIASAEIDVLKADEAMDGDPTAPSHQEFFFHTDVHYSTYGEFWMTKILAHHLMEKYKVNFSAVDAVLDESNYQKLSYDFLGNTAQSAGKYFAGVDCFENYVPIFETDLTLIDKAKDPIRTGNFKSVVMNGYETTGSANPYWVTNYGQWPEPYYEYHNNLNQEGPKLLLLRDSTYMRGEAFLSLLSSKVTVIDIRYLGATPYVEYALNEEHYDAVIICAVDFWGHSFSVNTSLPDLPEAPAQTADYWIGTNGICMDTCNGEITNSADTISVHQDSKQVELVGWAADFNSLHPLSALYLQVGDQVIQCNYGIERTSVSDHYQNDDLKYTGFSVTFPAAYLKDGAISELSFVQVDTDGTHLYEPVTYQLQYS